MFGKFFISFLFLGVLAVQANPIQPVKIEYSVDSIEEIIEEIKEWINNFIQKIKDIINGMGGGTLQQIIDKIVEFIKNLIGQASAKVEECIQAEMPKIQDIAMQQQANMAKCVNDQQANLQAIMDKAYALKDEAFDSVKQAAGDAAMCIISGSPTECIKGVWEKLMEKYEELKNKAMALVGDAQNIAVEVGMCSQKVQEETEEALKGVYQDVVTCVQTYEQLMKFANF